MPTVVVATIRLLLGVKAGYGVIAVDPVIPLRSKVYVPGYGIAIAGDTGGSIKVTRSILVLITSLLVGGLLVSLKLSFKLKLDLSLPK